MTAPRSVGTETVVSALLLRTSAIGEADAMVSLFTEEQGRIDAFAPSARRPTKTKRLLLEPLHTLRVGLHDRVGRDLPTVRSATVSQPRTALLASLDGLEAAGQLLRWLRSSLPARHPEPEAWTLAIDSLDQLSSSRTPALLTLASFGLRFLTIIGYQLELTQCIRCGKPCPEGRAAYLDPGAGGVRCAACGGGPFLASGVARAQMAALQDGGLLADPGPDHDDLTEMVGWLAAAYEAHSSDGRFAKVRRQ